MAPRAIGFNLLCLQEKDTMTCKRKARQVREGNKPGPKTVRVKSHPRSKPSKCR